MINKLLNMDKKCHREQPLLRSKRISTINMTVILTNKTEAESAHA
jgi:hypothetical protein